MEIPKMATLVKMDSPLTSFTIFVVVIFGYLDFKLLEAAFLEEVCMLPEDGGHTCQEATSHLQYYFNTDMEKCMPFVYKGCGGNNNRFSASDDCADACQVDWFQQKSKKKGFLDSNEESLNLRTLADCHEEKETGPCRALISQWYYDKISGTCLGFSYGGCLGNKNRFNTEEECKTTCMHDVKYL